MDSRKLNEWKRREEMLRQENSRLYSALSEIQTKLRESDEVIRAIREGEIDALVMTGDGQEAVYSLQKFDAFYRGMVEEAIPYGVWLAEPEGKLLYASASFMHLVNSDLPELREKGRFHFLDDEVRTRAENKWEESLRNLFPFTAEYAVSSAEHGRRTVWTHGVPVEVEGGLQYWVGVNLDVTERVQIREELREKAVALAQRTTELEQANEVLREASRRKDEFLALFGHELRNPLAPIRNSLHILNMPNATPEAVRRVKEIMENQLHHLTRLVDDLLDVSRITRGKIQLKKERIELAVAVGNAIESVRPLIEAHNHVLNLVIPPTPVYLEADATRLEQVLVNLLNNAAKYTKQGGIISVVATAEGGWVEVRVRDNGIGMPPELIPTIFDVFMQAERSLDRSQGGLGIGLTLVRKIVEMHGGIIEAFSEGLDKGSEFVLRLPAALTAEETRDQSVSSTSPQSSLRILVVDDSTDLAQSLEMLLELAGNDVRVANDGYGALVAYRTYHPDVVLLDIGLPGIDGYDVARQLRKEVGEQRPFIVAITGYGTDEDKRRAHEAGFDMHLTKPIDPSRLEDIISSATPLLHRRRG